jgi:hypothetical protein
VFLSGCEIIPKFNQCPSPKFLASSTENIEKYFLTEDVFAKFCPADTPKIFTYRVTPTIVLTVYLKENWIYLKANEGLKKLNLYTKGARLSSFKDYTHFAPISALTNNTLKVTIDKKIDYKMFFSVINCTCVTE